MSRRKQQAPCKVQDTVSTDETFAVSDSYEKPGTIKYEDCRDFNLADARSDMTHTSASFTTSHLEYTNEEMNVTHSEEPLNLSKAKDDVQSDGGGVIDIGRSDSKEEEHTCPICHKTFMSKYGLITHAETHNTPELKCSACRLTFSSRSSFIAHQITHRMSSSDPCDQDQEDASSSSSGFHKIKHISGFSELDGVDFTCGNFSVISENICSKSLHRLTSRDSNFFFLCKSCDRLFPTLGSLGCHIRKHHEPSAEKINEEPCQDKDESLRAITSILGLKPTSSSERNKNLSSTELSYAIESADVRTSPAIAALLVPAWMRSTAEEEKEECFYDTEISRDSSERRPALKLKLVRRRPTSDGEKPQIPNKYFIEDVSDADPLEQDENEVEAGDEVNITNGERVACEACGEFFSSKAALAGHKAASICGIGVGPSSNGRRMFWCRLCNYASCEKSTILRHQRTHTGLRPYSCKLCSIAFTTKANCERHIRKRHRVRVSSDTEVKNAVYCDYDLLRKARDGEINIPPTASVSNPAGGKFFSFVCRICKATFTSRNSGARHVMAKHSIMNRKRASEYIHCVRVHEKKSHQGHDTLKDDRSESRANMLKEGTRAKAYEDIAANKKVALKVPKLIPLLKIRSHYEASLQLAERFCEEYTQVFDELNKIRQDSQSLSAKLLSLMGSASALIEQRDNPAMTFRHISPVADDVTDYAKDDVAHDDEAHHFGDEVNSDVQQYSPNLGMNGNHSSYESPPESPFKPWKTPSSALLLRHFAANSAKHSSDLPISASQEYASDLSNPISRAAKKFNMASSKSQMETAQTSSGFGWTSFAAPKLRDERGRYVRDPNSPHPPKPAKPKASTAIIPYRSHIDLPTMVPMRGGNVGLNLTEKTQSSAGDSNFIGRKCPKCDKIFPWASSLSRHIMTHTGLKPYMCAKCSMRFTTRSNLLRHAYRRHGLERGSSERHDVLITLSLNEQKEHAEKEAQRLAKMGEKMEELVDDGEEPQERSFETENFVNNESKVIVHSPQTDVETGFYNKRYMCGMCRQPFANRSNLVRHLQRLHRITKDDPEFRDLLIKIQPAMLMKQSQNSASVDPPDLSAREMSTPTKMDVSTPLDISPAITNGNSSFQDIGSSKLKAFTCGICSIGFTKRNNAARHIQHQHNVSRKSAHFHQLIIRNFDADVGKDEAVNSPQPSFAGDLQSEDPNNSPLTVEELPMDPLPERHNELMGEAADIPPDNPPGVWEEKPRLKKLENVASVEPLPDVRPKKRDIRLTHFICGVCKRIFKEVEELKEHLNEHNIPHPWQCTICGVPFTNKYNCQRHLIRRHGLTNVEPKYVEDVRHGPKHPRRKGKGYARRTLQNKIKIGPKLEATFKPKLDP